MTGDPRIARWQREGRLYKICPEVAGGLAIPRPAAELVNGDGYRVIAGQAEVQTASGQKLTGAFLRGAHMALELARERNIGLALLKSHSPSCGNTQVYSGSFNGVRVPGSGVSAALLEQNGIQVFNENQIDALEQALALLDINN